MFVLQELEKKTLTWLTESGSECNIAATDAGDESYALIFDETPKRRNKREESNLQRSDIFNDTLKRLFESIFSWHRK